MLLEIRVQLLPGFIGVQEKLLSCFESQSANVTVREAGRGPDKSYDLQISLFRHINMIARLNQGSQIIHAFFPPATAAAASAALPLPK